MEFFEETPKTRERAVVHVGDVVVGRARVFSPVLEEPGQPVVDFRGRLAVEVQHQVVDGAETKTTKAPFEERANVRKFPDRGLPVQPFVYELVVRFLYYIIIF